MAHGAIRRRTSGYLSEIPDEVALAITSTIGSAKDLGALSLACKRFSIKYVTAVAPAAGSDTPAKEPDAWSIVDESARRWLAKCPEHEQAWVPRRGRESWVGLMHEVETLRRAAMCFPRAHEQIRLTDGRAAVTWAHSMNHHAADLPAAVTTAVMRAGRHFAQLTVGSDRPVYFGLVPPNWNVEEGGNAFRVPGHCFYFTHTGHHCSPGKNRRQHWEGMQRARKGDRIGLLLDFDQGSLTVFRNGSELGKMVASGLNREYCWGVVLHNNASARIDIVSVEHALEEAEYRKVLDRCRPYKPFVQRYAGGALRKWQETNEERLKQIEPPLSEQERMRCTKHVRIAIVIRRMFARLIVLLKENPMDYKRDINLSEQKKIKATLEIVIARCGAEGPR